MLLKILDVNMSRSDELREFLKNGNIVVITDMFYAECLKGDGWKEMIARNTKILIEYPRQIAFLKPFGTLMTTFNPIDDSYDPADLLDERMTNIFLAQIMPGKSEWNDAGVNELRACEYNPIPIESKCHFYEMAINEFKKWNVKFKKAGLDIRNKDVFFEAMRRNINIIIDSNISAIQKGSALGPRISESSIGPRMLLCNHNAALFVKAWDWCCKGGFESLGAASVNDFCDVDYLANGLLFHGLITQEKRSNVTLR